MEENLPDEDIDIELAPIAVQLAYLQQVTSLINEYFYFCLSTRGIQSCNPNLSFNQLLGHTSEALEAYTDIINRDLADESSLAVAVNNLIALRGPKDISDGLRKLDKLKEKDAPNFRLARGLEPKISQKQRESIYANRLLLLLHANKMDQVILHCLYNTLYSTLLHFYASIHL